jgi:AcrR family transcriptional regulator
VSEADTAPRRGPKCAQVLEGARRVFMERGYEGASVDEIARVAGTSKATLYSYFPDKRQLFEAVMRTQCGRTGEVMSCAGAGEPVEITLRRMAASFATFLYSPGAQEMFRVCIAEAGRFPEVGAAFHASGPARARAGLVEFFKAAHARGELVVDDAEIAADQFSSLCKAGLFLRALLGAAPPDAAQIARIADEAVRTFLARYGAPKPPAAAPALSLSESGA